MSAEVLEAEEKEEKDTHHMIVLASQETHSKTATHRGRCDVTALIVVQYNNNNNINIHHLASCQENHMRLKLAIASVRAFIMTQWICNDLSQRLLMVVDSVASV